jgi:hypothetical protein
LDAVLRGEIAQRKAIATAKLPAARANADAILAAAPPPPSPLSHLESSVCSDFKLQVYTTHPELNVQKTVLMESLKILVSAIFASPIAAAGGVLENFVRRMYQVLTCIYLVSMVRSGKGDARMSHLVAM